MVTALTPSQPKGSQDVKRQGQHQGQASAAQKPRETAHQAWKRSLFDEPWHDQTERGSWTAAAARRHHDRRDHEDHRLAAALGPRLLCRGRPQEARLDANVREDRRRANVSCACRKAIETEVGVERPCSVERLTMSGANKDAIERKLDRLRTLSVEEMRLEWKRLYGVDPPGAITQTYH